MTFYNIIFGILFLGACRQVLFLADKPEVLPALIVMLLVFNDAMNTSNVLEGGMARGTPPKYTIFLKIIDLLNFFLLTVALLALKPTTNSNDNFFQVPLAQPLVDFLSLPWVFWALLTGYWALAILWNWRANLYDPAQWPKWLIWCSHLLSVFFVVALVLSLDVNSFADIPRWWQGISLAAIAVYMLILKPFAVKS